MSPTRPRPTELMLDAMADAATDPQRRIPSTYTTNTTAGMVTRGLATPGEENYLTATGVTELRRRRPNATIGLTPADRAALTNPHTAALAEHGHPHLRLTTEQITRTYPSGPIRCALGTVDVPGVIVFGWTCQGCTAPTPRHDAPYEAAQAAREHAQDPECAHNRATLAEAERAVAAPPEVEPDALAVHLTDSPQIGGTIACNAGTATLETFQTNDPTRTTCRHCRAEAKEREWGVFKDGLCEIPVQTYADGLRIITDARRRNPHGRYQLLRLCPDHLDADQAINACDFCDQERAEEAEDAAEGRVIAHQGTGRGMAPEHAEDPNAREAATDLEAAGLTLADLPQEYDPETSTANGCMVVPRGPDVDGDWWVYVYYLVNGQVVRRSEDPDRVLSKIENVLRAAGWGVDPLSVQCVRAVKLPASDPASEPAPSCDRADVHAIVEDAERRQ